MFISLFGGVLIGLACVLLMASLGKVAGISTLTARVFSGESWRIIFLLGLILGAFIVSKMLQNDAIKTANLSSLQLIFGGIFVGLGTSLSNGCTSGHGVCGNALLSPRSLVATLIFMASGFLTVWIF